MSAEIRAKLRSIPLLGPVMQRTWRWIISASPLASTFARREIMKKDALLAFWRTEAPEGNEPQRYIHPIERSRALLNLIQFLPADAKILEVGCNVGRNLAYLVNAGYGNVEGVEISPHAVALLRKSYPALADIPIHLGSAEDVLPTMDTRSFDLVFTMAVLEHIHPDSTCVFDDIARLSGLVLAIEPTKSHRSARQYPHDLERIFRKRGFSLVKAVQIADAPGLEHYTAHLFKAHG